MIWLIIFIVSAGLVAWHYIIYPAVIATISGLSGRNNRPSFDDGSFPEISIIVIAHNEADVIEERIQNIKSVDYPSERIELIVASDASTDRTVELARAAGATAFDNTPHNKSETRNMAVDMATGDIILFTDADTRYEPTCVRRIVDRYADNDVGAVCGTLRSESFDEGAIGQGMGLYWRWEQLLRRWQGDLGLLVKMSGANMSMRQAAFKSVPEDVDIDQSAAFTALLGGWRTEFAHDAVAHEQFPISTSGEFSTRQRLTIRALTALCRFRAAFDPRRPLLALTTFSYWLLRYLIPFLLLVVLLSSAALSTTSRIALVFLVTQIFFYTLATIGYAADRNNADLPGVSFAFSYCWANLGVAVGVIRYISGDRVYAYSSVD
ncbi:MULTISPECIES: glycosyltransferase [Haloarcula]|uniref:glycosyltransferase n=1 Tax=Haloarcula TaxID=2237 RepID=UPI000F8D224F|nr:MULTISPECIES: glycosyltransferase [Haloarcula]NHX41501.1 glycosyltransferase [Haloarcula sp. R1-2]